VTLSLARERRAWSAGRLLVGLDEVGRGPLAGPVVAAAVVFPRDTVRIRAVRDSKTVARRAERDALAAEIARRALALAVAAASVPEIDRLNIRVATALAMRRALARVRARLAALDHDVLVDGLPVPELGCAHEGLVGGDATCYSVAAAGLVAKVVRDRLMARLARRHAGYGWETNAGYGTAQHLEALGRVGPSRHHRRSFAPVGQLPLL